MVSKSLLEELKIILNENYHQNLTNEQVSEIGNGLVKYFSLLLRPVDKDNYQNEKTKEKNYI